MLPQMSAVLRLRHPGLRVDEFWREGGGTEPLGVPRMVWETWGSLPEPTRQREQLRGPTP